MHFLNEHNCPRFRYSDHLLLPVIGDYLDLDRPQLHLSARPNPDLVRLLRRSWPDPRIHFWRAHASGVPFDHWNHGGLFQLVQLPILREHLFDSAQFHWCMGADVHGRAELGHSHLYLSETAGNEGTRCRSDCAQLLCEEGERGG